MSQQFVSVKVILEQYYAQLSIVVLRDSDVGRANAQQVGKQKIVIYLSNLKLRVKIQNIGIQLICKS